MQSILFGQRQRTVDACKAALLHRAVLALDHIIVDRDAHMVEAPAADLGKIVFGNKAVEPLVAVIALAHPAAEIDAAVKSERFEKIGHTKKPLSRKTALLSGEPFLSLLEDQPLTEPAVTPLMMDLERMIYTIMTGRIASRMNIYTLPMSNLE